MSKIKGKIKKFFSKKNTLIIGGITALGLFIPWFVRAGLAAWIAEAIFSFLFTGIILPVVGFGVRMAANFFEAMLNFGFNRGYQAVAQIGWNTSRDFANLLFILFMVVIAFATILRTERYGAKQLLPKVIIIALLINFSMVICAIVIDFSNLTAEFFVNQTNAGGEGIAKVLVDSLNVAAALKPNNCDPSTYNKQRDDCTLLSDATARDDCFNKITTAEDTCRSTLEQKGKAPDLDLAGSIFVSMIFGTIVLFIAMFTFFAGGLLLIIRIVFIWFLVILSPIVFICYIMPGLRFLWEKWWKSFINWCIFAPAYAFFVWLAVRVSKTGAMVQMGAVTRSIEVGSPGAIDGFFSTGPTILKFLFIIGLLLGGLIAAKQLGIYGASMVMSVGKKMAGSAKDWAKGKITRAPKEGAAWVGGGAIEGVGRVLQGIRGFKAIGERMAARGQAIREKPLEDPKLKKRADEITKYSSPKELSHLITTAKTPGMRRALGRAAIEQNKFSKLDNEAKRRVADNFQAFGGDGIKIAKELEARNPTMRIDRRETDPTKLAAQEGELDKKTEEGTKKGYLGQFSEETFDGVGGEMLTESMLRTAKKFGISIDKMVSGMTVEAQEAWKAKTEAGFGISPADADLRESYALVTKDYEKAFWDRGLGDVDKGKLGDFVKSTSPANLKGIDKKNAELIKEHVDVSIAFEAGSGWSREIKEIIAPEVEAKINAMAAGAAQDKAKKDLKKLKLNPAWAPYFT